MLVIRITWNIRPLDFWKLLTMQRKGIESRVHYTSYTSYTSNVTVSIYVHFITYNYILLVNLLYYLIYIRFSLWWSYRGMVVSDSRTAHYGGLCPLRLLFRMPRATTYQKFRPFRWNPICIKLWRGSLAERFNNSTLRRTICFSSNICTHFKDQIYAHSKSRYFRIEKLMIP